MASSQHSDIKIRENQSHSQDITWDKETDFLIVGSGAAGMTAAIVAHQLGLQCLVVEKSEFYGGTTALSGGVIWIPDNHKMGPAGIDDSRAEALQYLNALVGDTVDCARLEAYVDQSDEMLRFMEQHSLVKYDAAPKYPDYSPDLAGAKHGGRSLDPRPYTRRRLGARLEQFLRPAINPVPNSQFSMTAKDANLLLNLNAKSFVYIFWRLFLFWVDIPMRLRKQPDNRLTLGKALVARLRKSMDKRAIPLKLNASLGQLITDNDGAIIGAEISKDGKTKRIRARKGVLIGTGGFERNAAMRQQYQRLPIGADWTAACPSNTGDGISLGLQQGAALDFMKSAWWTPAMVLPDGRVEPLIIGKSMPGCMMVNKKGLRFTNDAGGYEDLVKGQYESHESGVDSIPAFLIFDSRYRRNYPLGLAVPPGKVKPDDRLPPELLESGFLKRADTIEALAEQCGIDAQGLASTVARMNRFAQTGVDEDFARGGNVSDRYYSDHRVGPNSCLAPIQDAPFYAVEMYPGDLGTKGGLRCDQYARVLREDGSVIQGLYASGNASAAVVGDTYPGAGATIGPAMTFAYIAAKHAAGINTEG